MSTSTVSERGVKRAYNFNAGPAALPLSVLERIREELLDWHGTGMSVMEMSHRSPEFEGINAAAEARLRKHLAIPDDYAVIFLQGGGSMQFTMVPMNLCLPGKPVDVLHTGAWTAKAIAELKKGIVRIASRRPPKPQKFTRVPRRRRDLALARMLPTSTCAPTTPSKARSGTRCRKPAASPLVADMSSDIASRPIDVKKFGLIFAGAQKNLGPAAPPS